MTLTFFQKLKRRKKKSKARELRDLTLYNRNKNNYDMVLKNKRAD